MKQFITAYPDVAITLMGWLVAVLAAGLSTLLAICAWVGKEVVFTLRELKDEVIPPIVSRIDALEITCRERGRHCPGYPENGCRRE